MIKAWILEENLKPFLEIMASLVDYTFNEDDWNAIQWGIRETAVEANRWYDYELGGRYLGIARDPVNRSYSFKLIAMRRLLSKSTLLY